MAQKAEINKGRWEARAVERFAVSAEQVGFPYVQQAAKLWRAIDDPNEPEASFTENFLITSHDPSSYDAHDLLSDKRGYWGIESKLHQRLDVIAFEDKSRVRTFNAVWNLAMFRRLSVALAIHWIGRQPNRRQATLSGFYDAMKADRTRRAFNLATTMHPSWLPDG